jgi:hypothetical protein
MKVEACFAVWIIASTDYMDQVYFVLYCPAWYRRSPGAPLSSFNELIDVVVAQEGEQ